MFPTFELALNILVMKAGLSKECLNIAPPKDPVRIHEKVGPSHHFELFRLLPRRTSAPTPSDLR